MGSLGAGDPGMPESERGGHRIDARALRFAITFPLLLCACMVVGGLVLAHDMPHGVVLPVGGNPVPMAAFLAVAVGVTLLLGVGIGTQGARTVLPRNLRRALLGLGMALQLASSALFSATVLGQSGLGATPIQRVDGYVLLMGSGLAAAMGLVLALTFKSDEQWTQADDQALAAVLELEADPRAVNDRLAYFLHPRSSVVVMILLLGILPGALLAILSPWFLLALPLAALLALAGLCATVHVDRERLAVKLGGVLPAIVLPCTQVEAAVSLDVTAKDYGGWGLRKHGGSQTFLAASGAAVVLRSTGGGRAVVGAPNLDTADDLAAILNRRAGKSPEQR